MSEYSLRGVNIPPEEFLRPFFDLKEKVCLRVFSDKPDSAFSGQKLVTVLEDFDDLADSLKAHNNQGRGIYFVINYGGHEDSDITRINAQFMECDNIPLEEQLAKIRAFALEPSLIVKTRKSLHCYWLMKNAKVERFRPIQKRLIAYFGADPACVNESRFFRLPGYYHCKEEPVLVECIKFNPELRYTQRQLEAVLPELPDESQVPSTPFSVRERGTQKGLVLVGRRCAFIQHCKRNAKTLPEPDWYAMISNLAVFEGGEAVIHKLSKPYPKYDFKITQAKIDHFHKSGTKPMTCRKIAEHGFVCPRMENAGSPGGSACTCKSPAGLAFRPMKLTELKKILAGLKLSHDPSTDLRAAQRFINDYLYNADAGLAEIFLKYDVRQHFGFKLDDIKPLTALYRDLYRRFSETREAQREKSGKELPDWYEQSAKGGLRFLPGILANHLADRFHAFYTAEQYYFYNGGVYAPQGDKDAKAAVRTYLIPRDATMNQINDAEGQWQLIIRKPIREINPNPYIINTQNGLYNVLDDAFRPHDPQYYSTVQIKAKYDPEAECPRFMAFLNGILDEPEIELLREIFGYFLVPITKAQKSFMLVGLANVGKSTILQVVQDILLGAENVSNIPLQHLSERFQPAELFGKLANIYADLSNKSIDDAGMFKAVTGEDYITGERKHKDPFSFKPYARFLYSCNDIPRNYGDRSEAFYRRLIIIRFSKPVPPEKRDFQLKEKLAEERDGILAWSISGLKRLIAQNYQFGETERTLAELKQYKIENNSVLAYVEDCCTVAAGAACFRQELYDSYKDYCEDGNLKAVSQRRFNGEVAGLPGVATADEPVTRRRIFRGIKLM